MRDLRVKTLHQTISIRGGVDGGVVFGDPRSIAPRRDIDPDRYSVAAGHAQHVHARGLADPARSAANGWSSIHDALHPSPRGQGWCGRTRADSAASDGGV